jgi:hypothetical protein
MIVLCVQGQAEDEGLVPTTDTYPGTHLALPGSRTGVCVWGLCSSDVVHMHRLQAQMDGGWMGRAAEDAQDTATSNALVCVTTWEHVCPAK